MPREWSESVKGDIETKFGMMEFALTQANHVHLSAGSGSDRFPGLEVNGVPYYVSAHLFRQPDGTWRVKEHDRYPEPYMSRKDTAGDPSSSARKKAAAAISEAWENFISNRAGHIARLEAEAGHVNNDLQSLGEDYEKAIAVVRDIETKQKDLLDHERDVQGELRELRRRTSRKHWGPEE